MRFLGLLRPLHWNGQPKRSSASATVLRAKILGLGNKLLDHSNYGTFSNFPRSEEWSRKVVYPFSFPFPHICVLKIQRKETYGHWEIWQKKICFKVWLYCSTYFS